MPESLSKIMIFGQAETHPLDGAAVNLVFRTQQVDGLAHIVGRLQFEDPDFPGQGIHFHFHKMGRKAVGDHSLGQACRSLGR